MEQITVVELTPVKAIKTYFESGPFGRPINLQELKILSPEDRTELGQQAMVAIEQGWK